MAIRSRAAEMEAGSAETSAGGGGGADSAPSPFSSWTIVGGRELALGGLSLKESPPWVMLLVGWEPSQPFSS